MSRCALLVALAVFFAAGSAKADVVVQVNKTTQRLSVAVDGKPLYEWPVSTARWGYNTPNGSYRPERLEKSWYSRKYDMSPMPHSIFFDGGYAIHGSYEISHLGRPASHGCIRLSPSHAATLYALVQAHRADTRIVVTGERPSDSALARAERRDVARQTQPSAVQQPRFQNMYNWTPPQDGWYDRNSGRWWGN